jgi:hypothetical protein
LRLFICKQELAPRLAFVSALAMIVDEETSESGLLGSKSIFLLLLQAFVH